MSDNTVSQTHCRLQLTRELAASPDTLFDYFTNPEHLSNWFAPTDDMRTEVRKLDLEIGGSYEIAMINRETAQAHVVVGEYLEIDRPNKLVYSWQWQTESDNEISQVTVTFKPNGDKTLLEITHEQFATQESRDKHGQGWNGCLNRLETAVGPR